jgi:hypothetical protein
MHRRNALKLRQQWARSPGHQRAWPLIEKTITTQKACLVTLFDEV